MGSFQKKYLKKLEKQKKVYYIYIKIFLPIISGRYNFRLIFYYFIRSFVAQFFICILQSNLHYLIFSVIKNENY